MELVTLVVVTLVLVMLVVLLKELVVLVFEVDVTLGQGSDSFLVWGWWVWLLLGIEPPKMVVSPHASFSTQAQKGATSKTNATPWCALLAIGWWTVAEGAPPHLRTMKLRALLDPVTKSKTRQPQTTRLQGWL